MTRRPRNIYNVILVLAEHCETFTPRNLTPALTPEQARRGCLNLAKLGELRQLVKGRPGRIIRESVYAKAQEVCA